MNSEIKWWRRWPRNARHFVAAFISLAANGPAFVFYAAKGKLAERKEVMASTEAKEKHYKRTYEICMNKCSERIKNAANAYAVLSGNPQLGLALAVEFFDLKRTADYLKKGADINFKGEITIYFNNIRDADPALLMATECENIRSPEKQTALARLLLDAGANPNPADDKTGNTPLHHASAYKNIALANLLLEKGAEADIKNKNGQTPLDLAREKNASEITDMLTKWPILKKQRDEQEAQARSIAIAARHQRQISRLDRLLPAKRRKNQP